MKDKIRFSLLALLLACGPALADLSAALADPDRPDRDKEMDVHRKPGQVIEFLGIEPGMSVIDIFAGGGYYSEILSRVVGDEGFITLYNNSPWDGFVSNALEARLANNRLPNVDNYIAAPEDLMDLPDKYDAAIFVLGMHDVYVTDEENGWPQIDRERFLSGIYNLLADGGVLGVIDHNAAPGTDPAVVGKTLHRVDPAIVIRDLEAVGFKLEARSDILANAEDDHQMSVFDESVRRKTDRSLLRFRK